MIAAAPRGICVKHWACVCEGTGSVEDGPAGATYSVPCPGPPGEIWAHGRIYVLRPEGKQ